MSTQRSTVAWSSSSYLRKGALQGLQEENSRQGSCNLGVLWSCVLPLNSVGEGCSISITRFFSGLRDVLSSEVARWVWRSLSWTRSEFPQAAYQRLTEKKEDRFVAQMSLLSCDFSCMTVFLFHVDFEFVLRYCAWRAWYTVYEIPPIPWYPPTSRGLLLKCWWKHLDIYRQGNWIYSFWPSVSDREAGVAKNLIQFLLSGMACDCSSCSLLPRLPFGSSQRQLHFGCNSDFWQSNLQ